jgi:hypothetical protein
LSDLHIFLKDQISWILFEISQLRRNNPYHHRGRKEGREGGREEVL